jgi:IgA Peptidase M64
MAFYVTHPSGFNKALAQRCINIVFLAEGFFPHREGVFLMAVDSFTRTLLRTRPFHRYTDAITVSAIYTEAKVSLAHLRSGDECAWRDLRPGGAPPPDDYDDFGTPFGALFCRERDVNKKLLPRVAFGNENKVWAVVNAEPALQSVVCHPIVLIDNDKVYGGAGGGFSKGPGTSCGSVAWFSTCEGWINTCIHELGHSIFELDDEYDYEGRPVHPSEEPDGANTTIAQGRDALVTNARSKRSLFVWHTLMAPTTPFPTSEPNDSCSPMTGKQEPKVLLPPGATGLFEGANYSACKVYRPNLACRMRHSADEFCPICEWAIVDKIARTTDTLLIASTAYVVTNWSDLIHWTHLVAYQEPPPYSEGSAGHMKFLFYNVGGRYSVHRVSTPDAGSLVQEEMSAEGSRMESGWTTLLACTIAGETHIVAHSPMGQRLGIYKAVNAGPAARSFTLTYDSGSGNYPFTHIATFMSRGEPHLIGYDTRSGSLEISRIASDASAREFVYGTTQDPARVWLRGYTIITAFSMEGAPYVLKHNAFTGDVHIQSLDPPGSGPPTFTSKPKHWNPGATNVLVYERDNRTYVVRTFYGMYRAFDWIWPEGRGIEPLLRKNSLDTTLGLSHLHIDPLAPGDPVVDTVVTLIAGPRIEYLTSR